VTILLIDDSTAVREVLRIALGLRVTPSSRPKRPRGLHVHVVAT
jgi:hypothetical protein